MMSRIVVLAIVLLLAIPVIGSNRPSHQPQQMLIATTGRITRIDAKAKTMRVRGSQEFATCKASGAGENVRKQIGMYRGAILASSDVAKVFPQATAWHHQGKSTSATAFNLDEYTVVITPDTVFRDGGNSIRFEDFNSCEIVSIHGLLEGATLTASRVAKWN